MNITLNNRFVNFPTLLKNVEACSMTGCTLFRKEKNINQKVFAVCCDLILSKDVIPVLGIVISENNTIHKASIHPSTFPLITSNIKTIEIKIYDWETLEDVSDKFEERCHIDLIFTKQHG